VGKPLIPAQEWISKTSAIGRKRSPELSALDVMLKRYELDTAKTPVLLAEVKSALDRWKGTHGPGEEWKKSARNKGGHVELLTTLVEKGADSDSAWGKTPDFMHPNVINSRLGVLYLFGHSSVDVKLFNVLLEGGLAIVGSAVSYAGVNTSDGGLGNTSAKAAAVSMPIAMIVGNDILDGAWSSTKANIVKPTLRGELESLGAALRRWFQEFAKGVMEALSSKFNCEIPGALISRLTTSICSIVLDVTSAGIVSGAVDTFKGTIVTADAVINKVKAWRSGRGVEFASGHPTTVVDSINRGMMMSIGEGLWQLLKGAGNIGIAFGTAGAGLIAGIVIAASEMLAKIIYRLYEVWHMRNFLEQAAGHWREKDNPKGIHMQPFAFGHWYRKFVLNTPALGILTLNSGVCGDKMSYLSMFRDNDAPISSEEFLAGAKHLDSLKVWGVDYLKAAGFAFKGTDEMSGKLMQFTYGKAAIGKAHPKNLQGAAKVWDYTRRFATA
jgi:hypothetical protein